MVAKVEVVKKLGERAVLLPALIEEALAANDRLKIRLTMLQEAGAQASEPSRSAPSMEREIRSVGLDSPAFSAAISGARRIDAESFLAPGAELLAKGIADDLTTMIKPVEVGRPDAAASLQARLEAILKTLPDFREDRVTRAEVVRLVSARRGGADSLHLLVMDLHKGINRIAAAAAVEEIDGAKAHGLDEAGRARVRALMAGLNRTAKLAFGHPGLETTAAKVGDRLTIQNDIGATDAHVLVIHVDGRTVTTTYTDVHRVRAKFFMSMFEGEPCAWSPLAEEHDRALAGGEAFYLLTGVYEARDKSDLDRFLAFLGSRLVFLIDWNKARKTLQTFLPKAGAIELLQGAAKREDGPRAFLELGGAELVFDAVRRAAAGRIAYGVPLDKALGENECASFLRNILHVASEGLKDGRSARLIRDEIQADLLQRLDTAESELLAVVLRHLGVTRTVAGMVETAFEPGRLVSAAERKSLAQRAKQMEGKCDRLTIGAREMCARTRNGNALLSLVDQVENATDSFDEAAFLISLAPENDGADGLGAPLAELARIAKDCAAHLVSAIEAAILIPRGKGIDADFALQCVDAVIAGEREADAAERAAIGAIMGSEALSGEGGREPRRAEDGDTRTLVLGLEIARALEETTDQLAHAAISLRERMLQGLSA